MTANQINYWKLQEDKRSNRAKETETNRSNLANEGLTRQRDANTLYLGTINAAENQRHNLATETETNRSNVAKEQETYRSNVARESENNRSNLAREQENYRHNVMSEGLTRRGQDISYDLGNKNIQLGYANLAESNRHNTMTENITMRKNSLDNLMARLNYAETVRDNKAQLEERKRNNQINEEIGQWNAKANLAKSNAALIDARSREALNLTQQDLNRSNQGLNDVKSVSEIVKTLREFFGLGSMAISALGK